MDHLKERNKQSAQIKANLMVHKLNIPIIAKVHRRKDETCGVVRKKIN